MKARQLASFVIVLFLAGASVFSGCSKNTSQPTGQPATETVVRKSEKGEVAMSIEVSPKQPRLSDLVDLTITIEHPRDVQIEPPVFGQSVGDFAVRDYSQRKKSKPTDGLEKETIQIKYQLEPMFSGRHLIRSMPIVIISKEASGDEKREILESEPIPLEILSDFGDIAPDLSQVDPMLDPIDYHPSRWILYAIVVAVTLSLLVIGWWLMTRDQHKMETPRIITPEERAQSELAQLVAEQLPSKGYVKEFYLRLTGIVRVFIEGKTGIHAPEQTTEEFLRDMRSSSHFETHQANQLREFLVASDLVKYAGQTPDDNSIQESLERAREFISMRFSNGEDNVREVTS
jgi:hypothetical protein